ncbi:hypothetical protein Dimus_019752 [Dionaea muscipula]
MLMFIGIPKTLFSLSPLSLTAATKPFIPLSIRLHRFHTPPPAAATLAATLGTPTDDDASQALSAPHRLPHPWPEWVAFVDGLKSKGYLTQSTTTQSSSSEGEDASTGAAIGVTDSIYTDMKLLKDASLSFARDRFDIFKSLSTVDMQAVVKNGCPNLSRKVVNSAKRLRAFVGLDEADVCSACILRGSCDRAYLIFNQSEAVAGTLDIMRVLLSYALDPLVISDREKTHFRGQIESSTRRLLNEIVELSELTFDAAQVPPQPVIKPPSSRMEKKVHVLDNKQSYDLDMKRGDWMCPKCNFMNFSRNIQCLKCKSEGLERVAMDDVEMKKGDWTCSQCRFMNFARNSKCFRCSEPRPPRNLKPGDWECNSCDFWNYSRNMVCRKCGSKRGLGVEKTSQPNEVAVQYEDWMWKKPPSPAV